MDTDKLTKQIIAKMLKENTGVHFLDSGMSSNRHWQRNQVRDFDNEQAVTLSARFGYLDYTRNVYHFLCNALTYNKGLNNSLYAFERKYPNEYAAWPEIIRGWLDKKGYTVIHHNNTYNGENNLSQDFVYYLVGDKDGGNDFYDTQFCILQIHGGCDVRGGYTAPKIFGVDIDEFLQFSDGWIYCNSCNNGWYTDDNYHWYANENDYSDLDTFKFIKLDDLLDELNNDPEYQVAIADSMPIDLTKQGLLLANVPGFEDYKPDVIHPVKLPLEAAIYYTDDKVFCPLCASQGKLAELFPG